MAKPEALEYLTLPIEASSPRISVTLGGTPTGILLHAQELACPNGTLGPAPTVTPDRNKKAGSDPNNC